MSPHSTRREALALAVALVLVVIWGANFSVQKAVFDAMTPAGFLFVRYLVMPVCAVALLVGRFGLRLPRVSRQDAWELARLGFAGHFLHVALVTFGIHWSTAFSSSLILSCGPIFTLLILRAKGLEHLTRAQVGGVALALTGVLVFLSDKLLGGRLQATGGDLVLLVAASFFSWYTVAAKPLIERHGGVVVMGYATLAGSPPVLLLAVLMLGDVQWSAVSWTVWAGTLWAVVVSAFLGWLLWGWVNAVRGVARTAPLMYLMPPVAGLIAFFATGERFGSAKLLGAAIALAGVALAQFSARGPREAPAPVD